MRPYVASLVAYDLDVGAPGVHVGMPATTLTFVLPTGAPLDVGWSGRPATRAVRWSTLSGLHTRPAAIHHDGRQSGVQLALSTAGARALLGLPAAALVGELVELEDLPGAPPELRELPGRVAEAPDSRAAVALVQRALLRALARTGAPGPRAEVGEAMARLTRGVPVDRVAAEVGLSRRHLGTLVRAESGLPPKAWQRLARFEHSHRLLRRAAVGGRPVRLAGIAAAVGYADQAHLTREWGVLGRVAAGDLAARGVPIPSKTRRRGPGEPEGDRDERTSHDRPEHRPPLAHDDRP